MAIKKGPKSGAANYAFKYDSLNAMKAEPKPEIDVQYELSLLGYDPANPPKRNDMYVVCPNLEIQVENALYYEQVDKKITTSDDGNSYTENRMFGKLSDYLNKPVDFMTWAENKLNSDTSEEDKQTIKDWIKIINNSYNSPRRKNKYDIVIICRDSESVQEICEVHKESDVDYIARLKYIKQLEEA